MDAFNQSDEVRLLAWSLGADNSPEDMAEFIGVRGVTLTPPGLGLDGFDDREH